MSNKYESFDQEASRLMNEAGAVAQSANIKQGEGDYNDFDSMYESFTRNQAPALPNQPQAQQQTQQGGGLIDSAIKGGKRGNYQSNLAYLMLGQAGGADVADQIAEQRRKLFDPSIQASQDLQEFASAKGFREAAGEFIDAPVKILTELVSESLISFGKTGVPLAWMGGKAGTAGGGAIGSVVPGVGTAAGMAVGGVAGTATGFGAGSLMLEWSSETLDFLDQNGYDTTDPNQLRQAFSDPELMGQAKEMALKKGIPVAIFDAISAAVGGRLVSSAKKAGKGVLRASAREAFIEQPALGMAGEASGQLLQKGEIESAGGVLAEGLAELPGGAVEISMGARARGKGDQGVVNKVESVDQKAKDEAFAKSLRDEGIVPEDVIDQFEQASTPESRAEAETKINDILFQPIPEDTTEQQAVTQAVDENDPVVKLNREISKSRKQIDDDHFTRTETPTDNSRKGEVQAVETLGKIFGKEVVWIKNKDPETLNIWGTVTDDTVFLNVDGKKAFQKTFMHETLHRLKQTDQGAYDQLLSIVQEEGSGFDQYKADLLKAYDQQGVSYSQDDAWVWEELVADVVGDRGSDKTFWQEMYQKSPEAVRKLIDTIKTIVDQFADESEVSQFFKDFQKVHDTAVSVLSEFAAGQQRSEITTQEAATTTTLQGTTSDALTSATTGVDTAPPSITETQQEATNAQQEEVQAKTAPKVNTGQEKQDEALEELRSWVKDSGLKQDKILTSDDMMGSLPVGTIRKDGKLSYEDVLQEAYDRGMISEDELTDVSALQRLLSGKQRTVGEAQRESDRQVDAELSRRAEETAKRGGIVPDDAWEAVDKETREKWRGYARTKENPVKEDGVEAYSDGDDWYFRREGAKNWTKASPSKHIDLINQLDERFPDAISQQSFDDDGDLVPFSISKDKTAFSLADTLNSIEGKQSKTMERIAKDEGFTDGFRGWAEKQTYLPKAQTIARDEAETFIKESQSVGNVANRIMANDTQGLDPDAQTMAFRYAEQELDRIARETGDQAVAEKRNALVKDFTDKHSRLWARGLAAMRGVLSRSWDTVEGLTAEWNAILDKKHGKQKVDRIREDLEIAKSVVGEAKEATAKQLMEVEKLKKRLAEAERDLASEKSVNKYLAEVRKRIISMMDRQPERFAPLHRRTARGISEQTKLVKSLFEDGPSLAIPLSKGDAKPTLLTNKQFEELGVWTKQWIAGQRERGRSADLASWTESTKKAFGDNIHSRFDNFADVFRASETGYAMEAEAWLSGKKRKVSATDIAKPSSIRKILTQEGFNLSELVIAHLSQRESAQQTLVEKLVEQGMEKSRAESLTREIESQFGRLLEKEAKKIIKQRYGEKKQVTRQSKDTVSQIIEDIRLGVLDDATLEAKFLERYKIKSLTPEIKTGMAEWANKIAEARAKYPNQGENPHVKVQDVEREALNWLMGEIGATKGDIAWSIGYANILSGPMTHAVNILANEIQVRWNYNIRKAQLLTDRIRGDSDAKVVSDLFGAVKKMGWMIGLTEGKSVLETGIDPLFGDDKFRDFDPNSINPLETDKSIQKGGKRSWMRPWRMVRRMMIMEDIISRARLQELQVLTTSAEIAKSEGLTGKALARRIGELMGYDPMKPDIAKFEQQAKSEGLTDKNDIRRRTFQLLEQSRPQQVTEEAVTFSKRETFNAPEATGFPSLMDEIAKMMRKSEVPVAGDILKAMSMFSRVTANILNLSAEYSPLGFIKAYKGKTWRFKNGRRETVEIGDEWTGQLRDLHWKATIGTSVTGAFVLSAITSFLKWQDDPEKDRKDPYLTFHAMGPRDFRQRKIWRDAGGKPWSIKVGDSGYISLAWAAPLAIPAAMAGLVQDEMRYNKTEGEKTSDSWARVGAALTIGMGQYILDMSTARGVNQFFKLFDDGDPEQSMQNVARYFSGFQGLVVPNVITQIERFYDPKIYKSRHIIQNSFRNMPFYRGAMLHPSLNVFGEEIESFPSSRFYQPTKDDPDLMFLVNNNVRIQYPSQSMTVWDSETQAERPVTETEYYYYVKAFGERFKEYVSAGRPYLENTDEKIVRKQVSLWAKQSREYAKLMLYDRMFR